MHDDGSIISYGQQQICEATSKKQFKIAQCDAETGEVIQAFSSATEAGKNVGLNKGSIFLAIVKNGTAGDTDHRTHSL